MIYCIHPSKLYNFVKKNKIYRLLNFTNEDITDNINVINKKSLNKEKLMKDYINFIGELNIKYNSLLWWANSISSKNQFVSSLFINICKFLQFVDIIKKEKEFIILIDDIGLIEQINYYCKKRKIKIIFIGWKFKIITKSFHKIIIFIFNTFCFIGIEWYRKYLINKNLRKKIIENIEYKKSYYIIRSWVDSRSFNLKNDFYDVFFGELDGFIKNKKNVIFIVKILSDFNNNLLKIKNIKDKIIIPQEYFLNYLDYFKSILLSLKKSLIYNSNEIFYGYNIKKLIQNELDNNLMTGEIRNNLLYYFIVKNISTQLQCEFFTYTFENHSWEKMIILGLRKYSKNTRIIGYQHSCITKRLFCFFHDDDINIIPTPDKIITAGKISKDILVNYCNYNSDIVKEGCSLRFGYLYNITTKDNIKKDNNILIATSASITESIDILSVVCKTLKNEKFKLIFRPHPIISCKKIKEKFENEINSYLKISKNNIKDDLDKSDILIYTMTNLCLEALMYGIPVIYVDINDFYNSDPLFECNYLKWTIKKEDDILKIINYIYDMNITEFNNLQILAQDYVKNYFLPVTKDKLEEFINEK